jgi:hypothetical protein
MKNVQLEVKDNQLIIRVDLTKDFGPSKSGKTRIIATTEGNHRIDYLDRGQVVTVGLNVYK